LYAPSAKVPPTNRLEAQFLSWGADPFLGLLRAAGVRLLLLESRVHFPQGHPVFSPAWPGSAAQSKRGSRRIQVTDTHPNTIALLEGLLNHVTWRVWSSLAVILEPLEHGFTELGRVSMPAILPCTDSSGTNLLYQSVSR